MSTTIVRSLANDPKEYLCLFHVITAGLLDDNIGSDEQEIIEMIYLIIDLDQRKVCLFDYYLKRYFSSSLFFQTVGLHRQYVQPLYTDVLSDECKEISGIDERLLFSSEDDLNSALKKVINHQLIK
jgi:hypothetical protein